MDSSEAVPGRARNLHVCLTFDFDAVSLWTATFHSSSPSEISRGEFGACVGLPRILDLLARYQIHATFFLPAVTARQFPEQAQRIVAAGHDLAAHGDLHERLVKLSVEQETDVHMRSLEVLERITGHRPRGFRAPGWELSVNTIGILEDLGLAYDSSQMATEFTPYKARRNDRIDGVEWHPGKESAVWELPVSWELDDFPPFFVRPPGFVATSTVEQVEKSWMQEFAHALNDPNGVFTLTMHPQVIGRRTRLTMLDRFIEYMRGHRQVQFMTMAAVAESLANKSSATGRREIATEETR